MRSCDRGALLGMVLFATAWCGAPNRDYTGLKMGNRWTFVDGSYAFIDQVDSTAEGWRYRRVGQQKCPYCKESNPVADTSWSLVRGDSVFQAGPETDGKWMLSIVLPPKAGSRWVVDPVEHDTMTWVSKTTVGTKGGTFQNCWKVRGSDGLEVWIEKQIGLVRLSQGELNVELESFQTGSAK